MKPLASRSLAKARTDLLEALWAADAQLALPARLDHKLGVGCQLGTAGEEERKFWATSA